MRHSLRRPPGPHALLAEIVRYARRLHIAAVLKPMGGPGEGFISFPLKGYAFAVDLPRRSGVEELHARLERITLDHGGRLYAAKDALMSAAGFARMFPAPCLPTSIRTAAFSPT
ncbi:MAG: hypothetical protein P8Y53_11750 [Pseudolabrys sp.]